MTAPGGWLRWRTWGVEYFLAGHALFVGLFFLAPTDSFGVLIRDWTIIGALPEWAWGSIFFAHGVGHLVGLERRDPNWCRRAAGALAIWWAYWLGAFAVIAPISWPVGILAPYVFACMWIERRLARRFP